MTPFQFSGQTLEELERVQGASGAGRGKVDKRGNRKLERVLGTILRSPFELTYSGTGRTSDAVRNRAPRDGAGRNASVLQRLDRASRRAPQVVVKITSRIHGAPSTVGAFTYVGRVGMADQEPIGIETSEGKLLTSAQEMAVLAREWQQWEMTDEARRKGATAIAMVFSMPPGTEPEKVREAVKDFAENDMANRRWVMALHTDDAHPHVHLVIAGRDNDGRRFNPNREFLQHARDRFAENLRDRGIEADASIRMTRGYPPKQDPSPVVKMRERGVEPKADKGRADMIGEGSPEAKERLSERTRERSKTVDNFATMQAVYGRAIAELDRHGGSAEAERAKALRAFVDGMQPPSNARSEIVERLRSGNVLARDNGLVSEPKPIDDREKERSVDQNPAARDRIKAATARVKAASIALKGGAAKDGQGEAPSTVFDRIRDKADTLRQLSNVSSAADRDPSLSTARERLQAMQKKMDQTIRDRQRTKDRDRSHVRDKDKDGPGR